jgi:hypothetical protein
VAELSLRGSESALQEFEEKDEVRACQPSLGRESNFANFVSLFITTSVHYSFMFSNFVYLLMWVSRFDLQCHRAPMFQLA